MKAEDLPVVGPLFASGFAAGDFILHGGTYVLELVGGVTAVLFGRPELLVGLLGTLDRLAGRLPFVPAGFVDDLLTVALVAMFGIYTIRFLGAVNNS